MGSAKIAGLPARTAFCSMQMQSNLNQQKGQARQEPAPLLNYYRGLHKKSNHLLYARGTQMLSIRAESRTL
jgi:hypothetical protein